MVTPSPAVASKSQPLNSSEQASEENNGTDFGDNYTSDNQHSDFSNDNYTQFSQNNQAGQ